MEEGVDRTLIDEQNKNWKFIMIQDFFKLTCGKKYRNLSVYYPLYRKLDGKRGKQ